MIFVTLKNTNELVFGETYTPTSNISILDAVIVIVILVDQMKIATENNYKKYITPLLLQPRNAGEYRADSLYTKFYYVYLLLSGPNLVVNQVWQKIWLVFNVFGCLLHTISYSSDLERRK